MAPRGMISLWPNLPPSQSFSFIVIQRCICKFCLSRTIDFETVLIDRVCIIKKNLVAHKNGLRFDNRGFCFITYQTAPYVIKSYTETKFTTTVVL